MKVLVLMSLCILVSCNGGFGSKKPEITPAPYRVIKSISDSTLVSFTQMSGVAKSNMNLMDLIIARAYAATGNISCYSGEDVSFDMDIQLGGSTQNLLVDATCGDDIELKVRQSMLTALGSHILVREKSQAPVGSGYWLDFSVDGFSFDTPYTVKEKVGWAGVVPNAAQNTCYLDYTFNYLAGNVNVDTFAPNFPNAHFINSQVNTDHGVSNPNAPSPDNNYVGCNTTGNKMVAGDFRFKDGKIEIDQSGRKAFSPNGCGLYDENTGALLDYKENGDGNNNCPDVGYDSTFERFCIDDNADGNCDSI